MLVTHPVDAAGFGLMRRFAYDEMTGRLARLRSERFVHPPGPRIADDLAAERHARSGPGPAVRARPDREHPSGVRPIVGDALGPDVHYDSLSRLVSETSRECSTGPTDPWFDGGDCPPAGPLQDYTEQFTFDLAGNVTQIRHDVGATSPSRTSPWSPGTNRIATMAIGADTYRLRLRRGRKPRPRDHVAPSRVGSRGPAPCVPTADQGRRRGPE